MNSLYERERDTLHALGKLRHTLLDNLSDAELAYKLPGNNVTLGELCLEEGQFEQMYIDSFKTFVMSLPYEYPDRLVATNMSALKAWFAKLETDAEQALENLSEDDANNKKVTDQEGYHESLAGQYDNYRLALLIFYAKVSIYLKALGKSYLSDQWKGWIG